MDALLLLKTTTTVKKGKGKRLVKTRRCPTAVFPKPTKGNKVKDKGRHAILVLTLMDEQAALVAPESNQLLHLQLRKWYYAQVLNFMRIVEGAM